ncbi:hypothetical protein KFL_001550160 [Klebsormidium nitens]|uniref:Uncharacterized protein n=1 Tax=Klebsormidium nitens TaxID=105231 RepID=A0A1Y1I4H6_KLENI|nr:hypothetical protein KFL_001550160 [Klebsormidium nitens]|eukprot:GAQ83626.1 hypothetical protein KFL_001550160 [Klebsormidium nitens]
MFHPGRFGALSISRPSFQVDDYRPSEKPSRTSYRGLVLSAVGCGLLDGPLDFQVGYDNSQQPPSRFQFWLFKDRNRPSVRAELRSVTRRVPLPVYVLPHITKEEFLRVLEKLTPPVQLVEGISAVIGRTFEARAESIPRSRVTSTSSPVLPAGQLMMHIGPWRLLALRKPWIGDSLAMLRSLKKSACLRAWRAQQRTHFWMMLLPYASGGPNAPDQPRTAAASGHQNEPIWTVKVGKSLI